MTTATDHKNTCRNNSQFSRRNSTSSNRSPAQYWIPEHEVLLQWFPYGGYGRLPWPNHCRTHPFKILDPVGLPVRHDGAYGHGAGGRDHSIWHPGPSNKKTTWEWPDFDANPEQENLAQMSRWSLNSTPAWEFPPLAIANQYQDQQTNEVK